MFKLSYSRWESFRLEKSYYYFSLQALWSKALLAAGFALMAEPLSLLRLLIVDDNPQMRTIMNAVLSAAGVADIHQSANGLEGLEKLSELSFDCIYCDFEMPHMNGVEFVDTVRRNDSVHRYTPIIMLTGYSDYAHLSLARDKGVTEFLRKPVTARDILLRLEAVILRP